MKIAFVGRTDVGNLSSATAPSSISCRCSKDGRKEPQRRKTRAGQRRSKWAAIFLSTHHIQYAASYLLCHSGRAERDPESRRKKTGFPRARECRVLNLSSSEVSPR